MTGNDAEAICEAVSQPNMRFVPTKSIEQQTAAERCAAMTPDQARRRLWAQRLKRVFGIDIETCPSCGGSVRIIACIEDPDVIEKILTHLDMKAAEPQTPRPAPWRSPPQRGLFD